MITVSVVKEMQFGKWEFEAIHDFITKEIDDKIHEEFPTKGHREKLKKVYDEESTWIGQQYLALFTDHVTDVSRAIYMHYQPLLINKAIKELKDAYLKLIKVMKLTPLNDW